MKCELMIKILWAPFNQTFKMSPHKYESPDGSRFYLGVSNLDGINGRHKLGGTDHADILHLSGKRMHDFISNFRKGNRESSQTEEGQSSKRSLGKRRNKNRAMLLLHIQFITENVKQMVNIFFL
jgi:hypothetical protein